ncbi:putative ribonuclease H-like domain-containing protein [Senna tora]|uniref:Putative ribonuclease H-like domain-containing protein n=1 Tax=Senna tora TaxID=362788 RepID=A0A834W4L3_9FABA|nr:putative ribonuclease H-like domain-containing protein [Senna tora]
MEEIGTGRERRGKREYAAFDYKLNLLMYINVDASSNRDGDGSASCGGLARDEYGRFICGFNRHLGSCNTLHAELWGILKGLEMARYLELRKVQLESDSLLAIKLIKDPPGQAHPSAALILKIISLLNKEWEVKLRHIYREGNMAADLLARNCTNCSRETCLYRSPPNFLIQILEKDRSGTTVVRLSVP